MLELADRLDVRSKTKRQYAFSNASLDAISLIEKMNTSPREEQVVGFDKQIGIFFTCTLMIGYFAVVVAKSFVCSTKTLA